MKKAQEDPEPAREVSCSTAPDPVETQPAAAAPEPADAPGQQSSRPITGIAFKVASAFSFTLMGATVKYVGALTASSTALPVGQIVFFRSAFALVPVLVWLAVIRKLDRAFRTADPGGQIRRGLIGATGMFFGFSGLSLLPLPDATAISFAAPLISVVLAATVLGEKVRLFRWTAVLVGFLGVIIMLWPHLSVGAISRGEVAAAQGAFFSLIGAICAAFAMIEVRKLTATDHTAAIVVYFSLLTAFFGLMSFFVGLVEPRWGWVLPGALPLGLLVLVGILGGVGQILLTQSYRHAAASVVAPFDYTSMIFALVVGYLLFGDVPGTLILVGASIVIGAGIFVILRERQLGIERRRQRKAGPSRII